MLFKKICEEEDESRKRRNGLEDSRLVIINYFRNIDINTFTNRDDL